MRYFLFFLFVFFGSAMSGQLRSISFTLCDEQDKSAISGAHVFVGNTTFGTISNDDGKVEFQIPSDIIEDLIISHISYDGKTERYRNYKSLTVQDTIFLNPNGIDIDEVLITAGRGKKWKKHYKKFLKAFIGKGKRSILCEIKNPEVLRFSEVDGTFTATAIDMLNIENHYLAYDLEFLLKELTIDKDGSIKYIGFPRFIDRSHSGNSTEIEKNRKEEYNKSTRHFFLNLIADNLDEAKYRIKHTEYNGKEFIDGSYLVAKDLVSLDSVSGLYHIKFEDFLEVTHLGFKQLNDQEFGFNRRQWGNSTVLSHPVSMLNKTSESLVVNRYGNIININNVHEYGYWADNRIASLLPFDYGFEFNRKEIMNDMTSQRDSVKIVKKEPSTLALTKTLIYGDKKIRRKSLKYMSENWKDSYVPVLLDINRMISSEFLNTEIVGMLVEKVGITNYFAGLEWLWDGDTVFDEFYADVKAEIYVHTDPRFRKYFFGRQETAMISIDEVVWGGVGQDGIPPLRYPKMNTADEAKYLEGSDKVYGVVINGEAKAYPKRILGWHEFVTDSIGGVNIAGVYCTLCGTMIAYDTKLRNQQYDLGTSGFLYRSNKLMYDKATQSLWSTIDGSPVLGPLTNKGIVLNSYPVVTTTWQQWKELHPQTTVLSYDTGHERNYAEGQAYKAYFSNDNLMFPVPLLIEKMKNKDEVFVVRSSRWETNPLAISVKYLKRKKLYQDQIADKNIVILTEKDGMSRAYYAKMHTFDSYKKGVLKDDKKRLWTVQSDYLIGPSGEKLLRVPAHRVFWFAWYNMFPEGRLVK